MDRRPRPPWTARAGVLASLALAIASSALAVTVPNPNPTPDTIWILEPNLQDARFGWSVTSLGDVSGDGAADFAVGAPGTNANAGSVFVYKGGAANLPPAGWWKRFDGLQPGEGVGWSISGGDVNHDGFGDIVVGAPGYDGAAGANSGRAYVLLGSASGLTNTAAWTREGTQADARFGSAVTSSVPFGNLVNLNGAGTTRLPSFNGDVYADIAVGAPGQDSTLVDAGAVYVFHGGVSGLSAAPATTIAGDQAGLGLGTELAGVLWVNNDNWADLLVGTAYKQVAQAGQGRVTYHKGSATGLTVAPFWTKNGDAAWSLLGGSVGSAGDLNADGFYDILLGAWGYLPTAAPDDPVGRVQLVMGTSTGPATTAPAIRVSNAIDDRFGLVATCAGRIVGDTKMDVVIGAPLAGEGDGRAEAYSGTTTGISTTPTWTATGALDANHARAISTAGDLNNDGKWELLVGAPQYSNGQPTEGAVFVYSTFNNPIVGPNGT